MARKKQPVRKSSRVPKKAERVVDAGAANAVMQSALDSKSTEFARQCDALAAKEKAFEAEKESMLAEIEAEKEAMLTEIEAEKEAM